MTVTVKLFAAARETGGRDVAPVELPEGATVESARQSLREHFPALGSLLDDCAVAVNRSFASGDRILQDGDELAILPPVSGG